MAAELSIQGDEQNQRTEDQDQPTGPNGLDKLRDRIFQQRLKIEQLRGTGNSEALRAAITELGRMAGSLWKAEEVNSRRRVK